MGISRQLFFAQVSATLIIIVVIVFISSLFTGMAVLVARFAGANEPEKVNCVVYQSGLLTNGEREFEPECLAPPGSETDEMRRHLSK
jgi:hypothetical protein